MRDVYKAIGDEPDETDRDRIQAYMVLAILLARPPSPELLERLSMLEGDEATPVGRALKELGVAAGLTAAEAAEKEFNRLFIGLERGELVPYASFYRTGLLQDWPLVHMREDMARFGVVRSPDVHEPEDHVAAILETMAGLIEGRFDVAADAAEQQRFFQRQIAPWMLRFFRDLERAQAAVLYAPVGAFGAAFLIVEEEAFGLVDV